MKPPRAFSSLFPFSVPLPLIPPLRLFPILAMAMSALPARAIEMDRPKSENASPTLRLPPVGIQAGPDHSPLAMMGICLGAGIWLLGLLRQEILSGDEEGRDGSPA